ncbi:MAG: hypothetical protein WCC66_11420 [Rhizobiaceae bacterium]
MQLKHLFLAAFLASAASTDAVGDEMAPADVAKFAAAWPVIAAGLTKADPEFDPTMTSVLESQLQEMAASDSKDSQLDRVVFAQGYADFETFAALSSRILTAARWAKNPPDQADLEAALSAINAGPERSADDKAALAASLKTAFEKAVAAKPADKDIATVRDQLAAIERAVLAQP